MKTGTGASIVILLRSSSIRPAGSMGMKTLVLSLKRTIFRTRIDRISVLLQRELHLHDIWIKSIFSFQLDSFYPVCKQQSAEMQSFKLLDCVLLIQSMENHFHVRKSTILALLFGIAELKNSGAIYNCKKGIRSGRNVLVERRSNRS
jgi:hypothetical protein